MNPSRPACRALQDSIAIGGRPEVLQQHRQRFTQLEPVAGGVCEEESALSNKASILELSSARRLFSSFSCAISFSICFVRFALSSSLFSMSKTGRQFNIAKQRRQSGKVETHSDLLIDGEGAEVLEVAIAVVGGEGDQQEENACNEGRQVLAIHKGFPGRRCCSGC